MRKVMFSYAGILQDDNRKSRDKCEEWLQKMFGVPRVLMAPSCTAALDMTALLLDVTELSNVFVPSYTFVSTANSFVTRGAKPVFVDIDPDTLNMNPEKLEEAVSDRVRRQTYVETKIIVPVHYAGVGCDMAKISDIAVKYGAIVVEDNAQGLFGTLNDKYLGTFGTFSATSFHHTKNFSCGEGGALFINDPEYVTRAEHIWACGTNHHDFWRGKVNQYTWIDVGSSFIMANQLALILSCQFARWKSIQDGRRRIWEMYSNELKDWAEAKSIKLPKQPGAYHMFYLLMESKKDRDKLHELLLKQGIHSAPHYLPLHLSPMGEYYGYQEGDFPVSEKIADTILRLPFYNGLISGDQYYVIRKLKEVW